MIFLVHHSTPIWATASCLGKSALSGNIWSYGVLMGWKVVKIALFDVFLLVLGDPKMLQNIKINCKKYI